MQLIEELSIKEIINRIKNYDSFEAVPLDHSFHIKIRDYVPFVCAAIHAGGNLRGNLKDKIIHSDYERWYEEDPFTDSFIPSMPPKLDLKKPRIRVYYCYRWHPWATLLIYPTSF